MSTITTENCSEIGSLRDALYTGTPFHPTLDISHVVSRIGEALYGATTSQIIRVLVTHNLACTASLRDQHERALRHVYLLGTQLDSAREEYADQVLRTDRLEEELRLAAAQARSPAEINADAGIRSQFVENLVSQLDESLLAAKKHADEAESLRRDLSQRYQELQESQSTAGELKQRLVRSEAEVSTLRLREAQLAALVDDQTGRIAELGSSIDQVRTDLGQTRRALAEGITDLRVQVGGQPADQPSFVIFSPRWAQATSLANLLYKIWTSLTADVPVDVARQADIFAHVSFLVTQIASGKTEALEGPWTAPRCADHRVFILVYLLWWAEKLYGGGALLPEYQDWYSQVSSWTILFSSDRGSDSDTIWHAVDQGLVTTNRPDLDGQAAVQIKITQAGLDLVLSSASHGVA